MPQLQFHDQGRALFVVTLRAGRMVLGRADHCDVALPSEAVSRVHCVVEQHADGARIVDRSRHGTTVNGVRIDESRRLEDGDEIGIGEYQVRYLVDDDAESRVPTASALMPLPTHDELMAGSEDGVAYTGVRLRFVRGPRSGES
ncbi:MAG: FHA domain-containing protein, partial [Myxococcota bacterium]